MTHANFNTRALLNRAVVIGGGFSGLATASLLAKQGWQVTLLEKNTTLGGRARVLRKKGFTFDMGPSWYMMPEVFERFFKIFAKKPSDYYSLIRLNPRYKVFFEGQSSITLNDDLAQNMAEFEQIEVGAGQKLEQLLARMKKVYQSSTQSLMYADVWSLKTWLNLANINAILSILAKVRLWRSWDREQGCHFKDSRLQKILGFPAVFLGGSPFNTPALYSILSWSDFGTGIWYPRGGMFKVVEACTEIAKEQGVQIYTDQEATNIKVANGKVIGVMAGTHFYPAEVVVGATDLHWLETKLLPKAHQSYPESYWQKKQLGISALLLYIGINKRLKGVSHHSMYFADDWKKNFEEIFETQELPTDPSLYISIRSVTDRAIVSKNSEEIVVLVPLAAKTNYTKDELRIFKKQVIKKVEAILGTSIRENILVEEMYAPNDFLADYNAYKGTALGLAHTLKQSLWFRPDNRSKQVKGLYYAGQYTNPGVGVPMAFVSAEMTAKMIGKAPNNNKEIFKKGSTTYYYSSLFFQGQVKSDVAALYAYVRIIDDFVDRLDPQLTQLEEMWVETVNAWNGKSTQDQVVTQFIEVAKRKQFKWEWINAFWKAMRSDLKKKQYLSFSELEKYMYGSAGVIGFMMAKILDLPNASMRTAALQGKAMQLLNFIRDVEEDSRLGRKYLVYKESWKSDREKWGEVIQKYLNIYIDLQREAEKGYKFIPKKYLVPIKTAADMYKKTARIIESDPLIVWERKVKPKKWQVLLELVKNSIFIS